MNENYVLKRYLIIFSKQIKKNLRIVLSLLVVGSVALDSVETPYDKIYDALGGSATYISLGASYFSTPVELIGVEK